MNKKETPDVIELQGVIDLSKKPNEVHIKGTGNVWQDFGQWLEATAFLLQQSAGYTERSIEELADYARDYLLTAANDYSRKPE